MNVLHNDDLGKLILRVTLGVLLLLHGVNKLMNLDGSMGFIGGQLEALGLPAFIAYGALVGEIVAPLMIILGIFSRIGGILVLGQMLFAIGLVHMGELFQLTETGGWALELQAFFLLAGVVVMFLGSGRYAIKED